MPLIWTIRRSTLKEKQFLMDKSGPFNCIDAFCGSGGLSLGLAQAGFTIRAAFDWNALSVETYKRNLGHHVFEGDACSITAEGLRNLCGFKSSEELDLFAGGPPCQGFSKQTRGAHLGDKRNALVQEYLRLVNEFHPRAFLLENVAMFAQVRGRKLLAEFESTLSDYTLTGHFYIAADYGVAQTRERFMLVGIRDDVESTFKIPKPTTPTWLTVGEVIGDLPEPPMDYSDHPDFPNHQRARVTPLNIERFSHVPEGGGWQNIPVKLRLKCHQTVDTGSGGWPDVYGRLKWDGQCPTITGGFDSFTRGRYGHPKSDRPLTPREAARLQGFSDNFVFVGTRHDIRHQIGNAVPPPLAHAVGTAIRDVLNGKGERQRQLFPLKPNKIGRSAVKRA